VVLDADRAGKGGGSWYGARSGFVREERVVLVVTITGESSDGGWFELTHAEALNTFDLAASGSSATILLSAAISGALRARHNISSPLASETTRALTLRAEGADLRELFLDLASAAFERLDEMDLAGVEFRTDGLLRTDAGRLAWGVIAVTDRAGAEARPLALDPTSVTIEDHGQIMLRARIVLP
jgi:hypothetical protein